MLCNMLLAALQVVAQQQIKGLGRLLGIGGHDLDQAAAVRAHGGEPHHLGIIFTQTFGALDRIPGIADAL